MNPGLDSLGPPPDGVAWGALWAALLLLAWAALPAARRASLSLAVVSRPRLWLGLAIATAVLLSAGYVSVYLRGGPRIIDATSYFLEARSIASGQLAFEVPEPSGSFRGRFLVTPPDSTRLGVIFPPGYPTLLSLGVLLGAPLWVGPLLGGALVAATHWLARESFARREVALLAASLSALCAALRYHTADTMSHGWAALLLVVALSAARRGGALLALAGLAGGLCMATRPMTGVVALALSAAMAAGTPSWRARAGFALGIVPGVALLAAHAHATTGSIFDSAQLRYYALADGPPGCFRWGFGQGVGCLFEHGDFVRAHLADGYGLVEALGTTGRRLLWHGLDVANAEPLALLVPVALVLGRRQRAVRLLGIGVVGLMLVYAPFYFDGSYPGGGARMFAEALPLEHVLIAWCAHRLRVARFVLPLSLLGFALRASYGHVALAERDGGRPLFEPSVLRAAGVERGLVFVDTDHGFSLGHDPRVTDPRSGWLVARRRDDAHDFALWRKLGQPPTFRYDLTPGGPRVTPFSPPAATRFEAEAEWPPLAVEGGFAHPDFAACASGGRVLRLEPAGEHAEAVLSAQILESGLYQPRVGWVGETGTRLEVELPGATISAMNSNTKGCQSATGTAQALNAGPLRWRVVVRGGAARIDYLDLRRLR